MTLSGIQHLLLCERGLPVGKREREFQSYIFKGFVYDLWAMLDTVSE